MALAKRVFAGFDDQMRAVQAVLGATGAEFDLLNEKAKTVGRITSYRAAQVAGAVLELGRAGFAALQIDAAIASVLALARPTGTELPTAAKIAAGTLRAFGLEADQMGHVADVMVATANNAARPGRLGSAYLVRWPRQGARLPPPPAGRCDPRNLHRADPVS